MAYEYLIVMTTKDKNTISLKLNMLGKDNWELVTIDATGSFTTNVLIMKRELPKIPWWKTIFKRKR